jgi:signal transduction histidine kinase
VKCFFLLEVNTDWHEDKAGMSQTEDGALPELTPQQARLLHELGRAFAARIELDELLPLVLDRCRTALNAEGASVLFLDRERDELYFPYVAQEDPRAASSLRALRLPATQGLAGAVLQSGRPLRVDDVAADPRFFAGADHRTGHTTRALLCAPLVGREGAIGVVQIVNPIDTAAFDDRDLAFLDALAGSIAVAVENARLYADLKQLAAHLEEQVAERTRDLVEKNRALEETLERLERTRQQLVAQEKLAALGALTAGIAHEIRNPLNFVNNFAELSAGIVDEVSAALALGGGLPEAQQTDIEELLADLRDNVARIHEHGRRAESVVARMLEHARSGVAERQETNLNSLLDEALALALHTAHGRHPDLVIVVEKDLDPDLGELLVVPRDLQRALLNLLANACYALEERKRRQADFQPQLDVSTRHRGDGIEIRIRDNGTGIPTALREQIFQPFFTTKPPGQGTGLGLSIAHDIIAEQHRGSLRVDSEEGEWTELAIVLPVEGD